MTPQQKAIAKLRKTLSRENAKWPNHFVQIPRDKWPKEDSTNSSEKSERIQVFRSRHFFAQVFAEGDKLRLSVNRSQINGLGDWQDGITWDELNDIKNTLGFQDFDAVEIYPAHSDLVNVANIRHLWILPAPVPFAWRNTRPHKAFSLPKALSLKH